MILATPGPVEMSDAVRLALARRTTSPFYDQEFPEEYMKAARKISEIAHFNNPAIIIPGSGSVALEAAVATLVRRGSKAIVGVNGFFGEFLAQLFESYGAKVVRVDARPGHPLLPNYFSRVLSETGDVDFVAVVHTETSTGVDNPVREIAEVVREKSDAIVLVDAVTSLATTDLREEWGIDIAVSASYKGLGGPPGLGLVLLSDRAVEAVSESRYKGYVLNLKLWLPVMEGGEYPYTIPVNLIYGLKAAVEEVLAEGLERVLERHRLVARFVRSSLAELGLSLLAEEVWASNAVTAFHPPRGVDAERFRDKIREEYGVIIAGSWGRLRGKVLRIGHMGKSADIRRMRMVISALRCALG